MAVLAGLAVFAALAAVAGMRLSPGLMGLVVPAPPPAPRSTLTLKLREKLAHLRDTLQGLCMNCILIGTYVRSSRSGHVVQPLRHDMSCASPTDDAMRGQRRTSHARTAALTCPQRHVLAAELWARGPLRPGDGLACRSTRCTRGRWGGTAGRSRGGSCRRRRGRGRGTRSARRRRRRARSPRRCRTARP